MLIQHIADEAICRRRLNPKTARIPHAVQPIPNASDMISYHEFCFPLRYLPIQGIAIHAAIFAIFPDICKKTRQENPLSKPVFLSFLTLLLFLFSSFFLSKISIFPLKPLSLFTKPTINTYEKAIRSHASLLLPCNKYACATIFLIARYWRHQF